MFFDSENALVSADENIFIHGVHLPFKSSILYNLDKIRQIFFLNIYPSYQAETFKVKINK